jgi:hypothetical protein
MAMIKLGVSLALALALAGCVTPDAGCITYGTQRPSMPPLPDGAIGAWVATTDTAMTRACK